MMIVVALTTTWMTTPIIRRVYAPGKLGETALPDVATTSAPSGVMICISDPQIAAPLVGLASALVRGGDEPVWVVHLRPVDRPQDYLKVSTQVVESLDAVRRAAAACQLRHEVIAFASSEPASDLVRLAMAKSARLVLLGTHRSTFGHESLGGVTGAILRDCESTVGILLHRGLAAVRRVRLDATGKHAGAVDALGEALRGGGAEIVASDATADLNVRSYATDAPLPAHPDTSLLLIRGSLRSGDVATGTVDTGLTRQVG